MSDQEIDQDPRDEAIVIRGGVMEPGRLIRRASKDREKLDGAFRISVFAAHDMTVGELVSAAIIPHRSIQKATARRIREAGFAIFRTGRWPHCSIDLGDEPDEDRAANLIALFDPPERTPGREPQR